MTVISVDTELLQLKSANVKGTVDRISTDVHTMRRGLEELQASWKGSAANNFQALLVQPATQRWNKAIPNASPTRIPSDQTSRSRTLRFPAGPAVFPPVHPALQVIPGCLSYCFSSVPWWNRSRHWPRSSVQTELRSAEPEWLKLR